VIKELSLNKLFQYLTMLLASLEILLYSAFSMAVGSVDFMLVLTPITLLSRMLRSVFRRSLPKRSRLSKKRRAQRLTCPPFYLLFRSTSLPMKWNDKKFKKLP